jgi:tetratricopeptide (TPR) repeat protein
MLLINLVVFLINPVIKIQFMLGIVTLSPLMAFIPGSRILKSDGYTILHCARSLNYNILTTLTEVLLSARFPLYYLKSTDKAFIESCTSISEAYQEIEKLMENENYTEAILVYEKLIEIRPDDATIMNNLAWLYHKTGEYQKAFNYSKAAISLSDDPDFKENYEEIKGILEISVPGTSDSVIN